VDGSRPSDLGIGSADFDRDATFEIRGRASDLMTTIAIDFLAPGGEAFTFT